MSIHKLDVNNDMEPIRILLDESDAFTGPWMATVDTDRDIIFEFDRSRTYVERVVPPFEVPNSKDGKINQIISMMRNIRYEDDEAEIEDDGEHIGPFWAGKHFTKALKKSNSKKWIEIRFVRKAYLDDREKTINECSKFEVV